MRTLLLPSCIRCVATSLLILAVGNVGHAQKIDFTKPRSHFPNFAVPYTARELPAPNVTNTPRIGALIRDGKLMLSMNDAIALALENNLDLAIARYNLNIADTDILRAKAGSSILGVNTGVIQNTPGGGVGGLGGQVGSGTGGTSPGAGGAGTGAGGLVVSTLGSGPFITSFDPVLTGTFQSDRLHNNCASTFCPPSQNTTTANFSYTQGFVTGTNLLVGLNNSRTTADFKYTNFSPSLTSSLRFQLTQHLLQGFGFAPNNRFIQIAKNNREISDVAFRLQVVSTVDQIQTMYWDLVYAYEYMKVQQETIAFAEKTLGDTKKQVEIGTLAPIEVVRAQSTVATNQRALTVAQTNLQLQQLLMKNALSRTLLDPTLADAEVIPTDTMQMPTTTEAIGPTQDLVADALAHRPELTEARISLTNAEISNKAVRSSLLPSLDLYAYYVGQGQGGVPNPLLPVCTGLPSDPINCIPAKDAFSKSYSDTLSQLVNGTAPDKGIGLTLSIPIRNRSAQATQLRSELEYRQSQLRLQQIENLVRIEVRNAQFTLQQNRAAVESAKAAVELARQSLDAEQKKYQLGASTTTLVLQTRTDLTTAESNMVSAMAALEKSRIEFDRAVGRTLERLGVDIAEAERGQVTRLPSTPGLTPPQ